MKIQLSTSGNITYYSELIKVENGYQVAYLAEGSTQKMCPVNQQFCDSDCHETCCHYNNGCVLPIYTKEQCEQLFNVVIDGDGFIPRVENFVLNESK
jgi:hypothetical protein